MAYDLIVAGGGIAGASLAQRMAKSGARVLVIERETEFRDRMRGECLQPWGVGEARLLGVAETLRGCHAGKFQAWALGMRERCLPLCVHAFSACTQLSA